MLFLSSIQVGNGNTSLGFESKSGWLIGVNHCSNDEEATHTTPRTNRSRPKKRYDHAIPHSWSRRCDNWVISFCYVGGYGSIWNLRLEIRRTYDSKCRSSQSTSTGCDTCTKPSFLLKPVTGCSVSRLNVSPSIPRKRGIEGCTR
jgi:hypothetical protein